MSCSGRGKILELQSNLLFSRMVAYIGVIGVILGFYRAYIGIIQLYGRHMWGDIGVFGVL